MTELTKKYNVIETPNDDVIGYWGDLVKYVGESMKLNIDNGDWEIVADMADTIGASYQSGVDPKKLYIISDNNGMGFTIRPYEEQK